MTVALATAILATGTAAWAQPPAAVLSLPIGTPLTIVADETVGPRVRPGSEFRAHLRDPIALGPTLVATAGTSARLVVTSKETGSDGLTHYHIAVIGLNLGIPGTLPVKPDTAVVPAIVSGMPIAVTTLAAIDEDAGKVRIAIPLPLNLSNEPPHGEYTPAPLRTAAPIAPRRRPGPRSTRSPSPSPSPSPPVSTTPSTDPSATPVPAPTASATTAKAPPFGLRSSRLCIASSPRSD